LSNASRDLDSNQNELTKALESASTKINHLLKAVEILAVSELSVKQIEYLLMIDEYEGMTFHKLVGEISSRYELPRSTIRWNLSKLRDTKLIVAGDQDNRGVPMRLTEEAKFIVQVYKNNQKVNMTFPG